MQTSEAFGYLECRECGEQFDPEAATHRCPACGSILDPTYDLEAVDLTRSELESRPFDSMWRYEELLPFPREVAVSMGEGATPLVECPSLAAEMEVERVLIKDESANPTGTFKDRGHSPAVTAASEHGASDVALASAGNAGQAAAAYASRAGLDAHVFLPSRAGFTQKAMVRVHGGDLTVVDGQIGDAAAVYKHERDEHDGWYPTQTFVTPYRHEGKKTMLYELIEQRDWTVPDAIVYPTGGGVGLVGMAKAAVEFRELGLADAVPAMYAAQSTGCSPIVEAFEAGEPIHSVWESPDTICGGIAIPDPGASPWILDVLHETDGGAVSAGDDSILDAAADVARTEGLEMAPTSAAAVAGARKLAARGDLEADDTVAIISTGGGNKDADVLRSHVGNPGDA